MNEFGHALVPRRTAFGLEPSEGVIGRCTPPNTEMEIIEPAGLLLPLVII
jgi:hypothetical protein